jgi:hypothetical protein
MAVDLGDLIDSIKREVSVPGAEETTFPNATDDSWLGNLLDSFWEAKLDGLMAAYTADTDGLVTPIDPNGTDLSRDWQQMIVFYAGIRIVRNNLRAINGLFRAKAGTVEFETQQSSQLLKSILDELRYRLNLILTRLSDLGQLPSFYIDSLVERDMGIYYGDITWESGAAHAYGTYGSTYDYGAW